MRWRARKGLTMPALGIWKAAAGATAADEQACAVRMADVAPSAAMPLRNARR